MTDSKPKLQPIEKPEERLTYEQNTVERGSYIRSHLDMAHVKELVSTIPFPNEDWSQAKSLQTAPGIVTETDSQLMPLLFPLLRGLVVINYLQQHFSSEAEVPTHPYALKYYIPNDVVMEALGYRLLKVLFEEALSSNEFYYPLADLLQNDNVRRQHDLWTHYEMVVKAHPSFVSLVELLRQFHTDHVTALYGPDVD